MFKEKAAFIHRLMFLFDAFVLSAIFLLALIVRGHLHHFYNFDLFPATSVIQDFAVSQDSYLTIMLVIIPLWCVNLYWSGMYRSMRLKSTLDVVGIILKSSFFTAVAFSVLAFLLKMEFISRAFFILFMIMASLALILEKAIIYLLITYTRRRGYNYRRLLIVGTGKRAAHFIDKIKTHLEWGLKIVGVVDFDEEKVGKDFSGVEIIGTIYDIPRILHTQTIDEVIFVVPRSRLNEIHNYLYVCEIEGITTRVAVDLFEMDISRLTQTEFDGIPLITFETTPIKEEHLFIKRVADVVFSGLGIVILTPLFLAVAIFIKLLSPGPVFYRHKRIGLNGRRFVFLKFRSMHAKASSQFAGLMSKNEMSGPVFKIKNDPRIYPFGKFLRKFSIDELPQLFNVFLGHMSLVGPRPPVYREVRQYEPWQRRRLSMRPGITCLWQVSGRSNIAFSEWMKLDLQYIDNWSLWLDFKILLKTIPAVFSGQNAY